MGVFAGLYAQMDGLIVDQVLGGYGAVVGTVRGPLAVAIGIYFAIAGYAVMRGLAGEGWGHLLNQGFKAGLVFAAVTSGLGGVTARSVMNLPSELAAAGGGSSPGGQIDAFVAKVNIKSSAMVHAAPRWGFGSFEFDDPTLVLISWVPKLGAILLAALMLVYLVFLKFALAVTALFGPIFVALLLFDSTRGMFFTWLGAALGYALSSVVIGLTIAFVFATAGTAADSVISSIAAGGAINTGDAAATDAAAAGLLALTAVIVVGILFLMQAQSIAQSMAGGGGGSGAMVAGAAIAGTVQMARNAITGGGRMARFAAGGNAAQGASAAAGPSSAGSPAFRAGQTAARLSQQSMRRIMGKG